MSEVELKDLKEKYPENFSLGLLTSSGSIGLLFPPSVPMIIYGVVYGLSGDLIKHQCGLLLQLFRQ